METTMTHTTTTAGGTFYITTKKGGENLGHIEYEKRKDQQLAILHTEVDEQLRGTGASGKLIRAVADYAREQECTIVPVCSFAKSYMTKKSDEFGDVLA